MIQASLRPLCALSLLSPLGAQDMSREVLEIGAAAVAKITASAVFVSGRTVESVLAAELAPEDRLSAMLRPLVKIDVDREARSVTVELLGIERTAVHRPGLGCALVLDGVLPSGDDYAGEPAVWAPDRGWPTGDAEAPEPYPEGVDRAALERAVDAAFTGHAPPLDPRTRAVIVVYRGKIVAERYADGFSAKTRLHGWSMTKSLIDALIGLRADEGALRVDAPADVATWIDASDQRAFLTPETLLRMSSGLQWEERYDDLTSDVPRMLFAEPDAAGFAAARGLAANPGAVWAYSSGTTNVLCGVLRNTFDDVAAYHAFPRRALFDRIGMRSALIEADPAGTFVGSSYGWATARDWARFGMLYLQDGVWEDERILPEGWVAASVTPTPASRGRYGRHWWLNRGGAHPQLPRDMFSADGFEGQVVAVVPSRDAVIVRLGCSKDGRAFRSARLIRDVLDALPQPRGYSIPTIDLAGETERQVVVDREDGQYLGHPTTVLLEDGETMLCVYPKGHGRGTIVYKRSTDGGRTWSERLPTPVSWTTSKEVPTIYRVARPDGAGSLLMFSGLHPIRIARSEDDGASWSELEPIGDFGGIVAMSDVVPTHDGARLLALFHDDGRFLRADGVRAEPPKFRVYATESADYGQTWSEPRVIATHERAHLCEPGAVRSPDGGTIALLLRENSRRFNSFVVFSADEGATWSAPRELPGALTGDRHQARYLPDGRLFVSFRDTTHESPTRGDWVAWVGRWSDLVNGLEGECRVRLMDNLVRADCAYPAVEVLPDGTVVTTTYGHWTEGAAPWIASVRLRVEDLDSRL